MYTQLDIDLARADGDPDPEGNALRANEILSLITADQLEEARGRLGSITDLLIRKDLLNLIAFNETCLCMPKPPARRSAN